MNDETIPGPAAEEGAGADKKPRRRRGGTRRHKSRGNGNAASTEEPRVGEQPPAAVPVLVTSAPTPAPAPGEELVTEPA